jgi:hypothetical protein
MNYQPAIGRAGALLCADQESQAGGIEEHEPAQVENDLDRPRPGTFEREVPDRR